MKYQFVNAKSMRKIEFLESKVQRFNFSRAVHSYYSNRSILSQRQEQRRKNKLKLFVYSVMSNRREVFKWNFCKSTEFDATHKPNSNRSLTKIPYERARMKNVEKFGGCLYIFQYLLCLVLLWFTIACPPNHFEQDWWIDVFEVMQYFYKNACCNEKTL